MIVFVSFFGTFRGDGSWVSDYITSVSYYVYAPRKAQWGDSDTDFEFRDVIWDDWNHYWWMVPLSRYY